MREIFSSLLYGSFFFWLSANENLDHPVAFRDDGKGSGRDREGKSRAGVCTPAEILKASVILSSSLSGIRSYFSDLI